MGGDTIETVWDGLQALEHYRNGQLEARMTYGNGLDEVIALEVDLDGDGTLEPPLTPIYDASGNLVLLTDESGKPVERMSYSPYGDRTIRVDVTAPAIEQLRVVGDELWLEVSEEVLADSLATAFAAGQVRLLEDATSTELTLLSAEQPVKTGRQAGRRIVLTLDTPPAVATAVTLTIEPAALVDSFLNQPVADFTASFAWPGADAVLVDTAPPVLHEVSQREGHLEIELSETIDPVTFDAGLLIDGAPATWITDAAGYRLRTDVALTEGSHTIAITTALEDLDGQTLTDAYSETIVVSSATPVRLHYLLPDERITPTGTAGNALAFHGRPVDEETGFLYFRNRYYDPELGRFLSADPLGYVDGSSQYAFSGNDPVNHGDPLGLVCPSCTKQKIEEAQREASKKEALRLWEEREAAKPRLTVKHNRYPIWVRVDPVISSQSWTHEEVEAQLERAYEILGDNAGVIVYWTEVREHLEPVEEIHTSRSGGLVRRERKKRGVKAGTPIVFIRGYGDKRNYCGIAVPPWKPGDVESGATVARYCLEKGKLEPSQLETTAHELGHVLGALCDPYDPLCKPRTREGSVMFYHSG